MLHDTIPCFPQKWIEVEKNHSIMPCCQEKSQFHSKHWECLAFLHPQGSCASNSCGALSFEQLWKILNRRRRAPIIWAIPSAAKTMKNIEGPNTSQTLRHSSRSVFFRFASITGPQFYQHKRKTWAMSRYEFMKPHWRSQMISKTGPAKSLVEAPCSKEISKPVCHAGFHLDTANLEPTSTLMNPMTEDVDTIFNMSLALKNHTIIRAWWIFFLNKTAIFRKKKKSSFANLSPAFRGSDRSQKHDLSFAKLSPAFRGAFLSQSFAKKKYFREAFANHFWSTSMVILYYIVYKGLLIDPHIMKLFIVLGDYYSIRLTLTSSSNPPKPMSFSWATLRY